MQAIEVELGERVTLKVADALKRISNKRTAERMQKQIDDEECVFHFTGSAAIPDSDIASEKEVSVVGSQVGRTLISFGPTKANQPVAPGQQFGALSTPAEDQLSFEVTVVPKKETAGAGAGALISSEKFNGLLPMDEVQEAPSENTPYGIGIDGKPVAPHPSMVGPDDSSVARATEDAEATGPAAVSEAPEAKAEDARSGVTPAAAAKTAAKSADKQPAKKKSSSNR